jgi:hypothetical protein
VLLLQGAAVGGLSILAFFGALQVWHVALASFCSGLGWASDNPVRRMMIGDAVGAARSLAPASAPTASCIPCPTSSR